jgi:hypothetical protein
MFPPGRYGRRREPSKRRRWLVPVGILVGLAIMSLIAIKLYFEYGNDDISANVISSTNATDSSITVKFSVAKSDGHPATCTVQAFTYQNAEVGDALVPVPAGTNVIVTYTLATSARAYIGEVPNCEETN